jgi:glucose-specific phosphotransferase system IIA component
MIFSRFWKWKSLNKSNYKIDNEKIMSPISGRQLELDKLDDFVFSKGLMGKGIAIYPINGEVYAPVSGELCVITKTKHAFGIRTKAGHEVLVHIGLKTELLSGNEFSSSLKIGDSVSVGQLVIKYNYDLLVQSNLNLTTITVLTNTPMYKNVEVINKDNIIKGEEVIIVNN